MGDKQGDPRFDPQHWYMPEEPILGFVAIPAGEFTIGSDPEVDTQHFKNEKPQHQLHLPSYYLARYPVTVAQFQAFANESNRQLEDRDSQARLPNHPVVRVTWYDALAYCEWLGGKLVALAKEKIVAKAGNPFWEGLAGSGLCLTLPSEAEWEKAARGADSRIYPWGDQADSEKANYVDSGIGATSAVGRFPGGASPYGIQDLSGNVWEWTRSLYGDYPYPHAGREREDRELLDAPSEYRRVLRGGSFDSDPRKVRCAFRGRYNPLSMDEYLGFRVVVTGNDAGGS